MKKRILALVAVLALVGVLVPAVVFSAESTVSCTVSVATVSLTVTDGSVDYGALELGDTENTAVYSASNSFGMLPAQTQNITNTGNVDEYFDVKTSNAVGATNWTLHATTPGVDTFTHAWNWGSTQYNGVGTITFTKWGTVNSYVNVDSHVDPDAVRYLELQIGMPTSVADAGNHTITVTVRATQS